MKLRAGVSKNATLRPTACTAVGSFLSTPRQRTLVLIVRFLSLSAPKRVLLPPQLTTSEPVRFIDCVFCMVSGEVVLYRMRTRRAQIRKPRCFDCNHDCIIRSCLRKVRSGLRFRTLMSRKTSGSVHKLKSTKLLTSPDAFRVLNVLKY